MKLKTVNVIEWFNDTVKAVHSFSDDEEGNRQAEKLFSQIAKDNEFTKEEIKIGLEEGFLEHSDYDYRVFLVHSE